MQAYSLDLRHSGLRTRPRLYCRNSRPVQRQRLLCKKMLRQWRQTSDLAPMAHGGGKPASLAPKQSQLLKRKVRQQRDLSLAELQQLLSEQESADVHQSAISRALSRLGLPRKKSLQLPQSATTTSGLGTGEKSLAWTIPG